MLVPWLGGRPHHRAHRIPRSAPDAPARSPRTTRSSSSTATSSTACAGWSSSRTHASPTPGKLQASPSNGSSTVSSAPATRLPSPDARSALATGAPDPGRSRAPRNAVSLRSSHPLRSRLNSTGEPPWRGRERQPPRDRPSPALADSTQQVQHLEGAREHDRRVSIARRLASHPPLSCSA